MSTPFCPGYGHEPFRTLVEQYPGVDVYPAKHFRVEWGPVFHRGRLDGSARLLVLGQDPAQHETVSRRILMGTAGRRVQGFLNRLGMVHRYVMVNTFLFSIYGQQGGAQHINDAAITDYRNQWLKAILEVSDIRAVVAFGSLADKAWKNWLSSPLAAGRPALPYRKLAHPTSPEASTGDVAQATKTMLKGYSTALAALAPLLAPTDTQAPVLPYGDAFLASDLPAIPQADLPAGSPLWTGATNEWAIREGATAAEKRMNIRITAPPQR